MSILSIIAEIGTPIITTVATCLIAYAALVGIPNRVENAVESLPDRWVEMEREFQEFHFAARRLCEAIGPEPESKECTAAFHELAE